MKEQNELPISIQELGTLGIWDSLIPVFLSESRRLSAIGFALEDIADAVYSDPRVITAIEYRDQLKTTNLIATSMAENLTVIERSGIAEDRLWQLTEAGLAVGEISWAIRNIQGFKENLLTISPEDVEKHAVSTYEFFRNGRFTRRAARTTRWGTTTGESHSQYVQPECWFDHYSKIVAHCGVGPGHMPESLSTTSVFGKLADPNYTPWEDMIQNNKEQRAQIEQRMQAKSATREASPLNETTVWIVSIIVIIGTIAILSLVNSR